MNVDAILFDLDGTLWNSTEEVRFTWNQVISRYPGLREPISQIEIESIMGLQMDVIARKMFPNLSAEQQADMLEQCVQQENTYLAEHGARLFAHVVETLTQLHKFYDLCIVSNCQCGYIEAFLKAHNAEWLFHDHICFGETGMRKGESIQCLITRNGYQRAVYVGDTQGDCDEAQFAGIPFIYAAYGFGNVKTCQFKIDSPEELLNMFEKTRR